MISTIVGWLLWAGLSDARAVAVGAALSRHGVRIAAGLGLALVLALGAWKLTDIGGDWREAAIRAKWAERFKAVEKSGEELKRERAAMENTIKDRVAEAVAAVSQPVAPETPTGPSQPVATRPGPSVNCDIPIDAIKALNRIK